MTFDKFTLKAQDSIAVAQKLVEQGIIIKISEKVIKYLATKEYIPEFGARPLKRLIQREIVNELAKEIIAGNIAKVNSVSVDIKNETIIFNKNKSQ